MGRYSVGGLTSAGSDTLPLISLYCTASVSPALREVDLTSTSATAYALKLALIAGAGTKGAAITTVTPHRITGNTAVTTAFQTHTVTPTTLTDMGYRHQFGAAVGAGVIWTFGDQGVQVVVGTTSGLGIVGAVSGAAQATQANLVWDE